MKWFSVGSPFHWPPALTPPNSVIPTRRPSLFSHHRAPAPPSPGNAPTSHGRACRHGAGATPSAHTHPCPVAALAGREGRRFVLDLAVCMGRPQPNQFESLYSGFEFLLSNTWRDPFARLASLLSRHVGSRYPFAFASHEQEHAHQKPLKRGRYRGGQFALGPRVFACCCCVDLCAWLGGVEPRDDTGPPAVLAGGSALARGLTDQGPVVNVGFV